MNVLNYLILHRLKFNEIRLQYLDYTSAIFCFLLRLLAIAQFH